MRKLQFFLASTYLWWRRELHDFDLTQEPESQKRLRHWVVRGVRRMEYNPSTQWRYHINATWFWISNFFIVTMWMIFLRESWDRFGVFYVAVASIYANAASDFTGVHAAWAALRGDQVHAEGELSNTADAISELEQRVEMLTKQIEKDPENGKD